MRFNWQGKRFYEPLQLMQYLKHDNGVSVVDRRLIENMPMFCATLNHDYKWDYTTDPQLTTVFFERTKDVIFGGIYCLSTHKKITCVAIASTSYNTPYIYPEKDIERMKALLEK